MRSRLDVGEVAPCWIWRMREMTDEAGVVASEASMLLGSVMAATPFAALGCPEEDDRLVAANLRLKRSGGGTNPVQPSDTNARRALAEPVVVWRPTCKRGLQRPEEQLRVRVEVDACPHFFSLAGCYNSGVSQRSCCEPAGPRGRWLCCRDLTYLLDMPSSRRRARDHNAAPDSSATSDSHHRDERFGRVAGRSHMGKTE